MDGFGVGCVRFSEPMEVISCAVLNGGSRVAGAFFIMQVPRDYDSDDPEADAVSVREAMGLPEDSVGMMTAAEVLHVFNVAEAEFGGISVSAVATAGLSNQVVAGDVLDNYPERRVVSDRRASHLAGTINIAVVSPVPLTEEGRINMFIPLVEAKSAAMADRGYRETGTTSDSMAVFSPIGDGRVTYTGTGSDIGISAARAVRSAVSAALEARDEHPVMEEPFRLLRNAGYDLSRISELAGVPEGDAESNLRANLSVPEVRALLDLVMFAADRADSMAVDGSPWERDLLMGLIERITGSRPDGAGGALEAVVTALSQHRCERWNQRRRVGPRGRAAL